MNDEQKPVREVTWWMAEVDRYGTPWPVDGPHSDMAGAQKAVGIYRMIGREHRPVVVRMIVEDPTPVTARADWHDDTLRLIAKLLAAILETQRGNDRIMEHTVLIDKAKRL